MKKKLYIHTSFTIHSSKRFVEPLTDCIDQNKYDVELWIEPYDGYYDYDTGFKVKINYMKLNLSLNPFTMIGSIIYLIFKIIKRKPEVIETHFTRSSTIPLFVAAITGVSRRIYHNHGIPFLGYKGFKKYILLLIEYFNCALSTDILTVSKGMQSIYNNTFFSKKLLITEPGSVCGLVDHEYIDKTKIYNIKKKKKTVYGNNNIYTFIYVGRAVARKGIYLLISAFEEYNKSIENSLLLIVGISEEEISNTILVNKNVKYLGFTNNLLPLYQISDIVILPSYHEGFGYSLLEGAAQGNALISSDIPGPDELVINGYNGFRFDVGSQKSLIKCMKELTKNPQKLKEYQMNARITSEKYHRDKIIKSYKSKLQI